MGTVQLERYVLSIAPRLIMFWHGSTIVSFPCRGSGLVISLVIPKREWCMAILTTLQKNQLTKPIQGFDLEIVYKDHQPEWPTEAWEDVQVYIEALLKDRGNLQGQIYYVGSY